MYQTVGFPRRATEEISDDDMRILRYLSAVLAAGFPLVALLQLLRVYGQALARVADAEVRLFHLYIHEPLMRDGVPGLEMAEQMEGLARDLLPLAGPIMEHVHQRFLGHFVEQDVIGHMEAGMEGDELGLGRIRVAIAFADLAGYTRLTEEEGEEQAVDAVERFIDGGRADAARRGSRDQDDRRRGDDRRLRRARADPAGRWTSRRCGRPDPGRASASTSARRSTATATTSGARSTRRRGWRRAPPAARCW